jgi:ABC-type transporter Mla subunit MlaD
VQLVEATLGPEQYDLLTRAYGAEAFPGVEPGMQHQIVEVEFELDQKDLKLDATTAAVSLAQDGLLGTHFLKLDPGYWSGPGPQTIFKSDLAKQDRVEVGVRGAGGLDDLIAAAQPVVRKVESILGKVDSQVLTDENLVYVDTMLENLAGAVTDARTLVDNLNMMTDREDPLGIQQKLVEPANRLIVSGEEAIRMLRGEIKGPEGRVNRILDNLADATDDLEGRLDALQGDMQELMGTATGILSENRADIAEIVRRLRRTMWQVEMAARKVRANPSVLVFGDDEKMLEATMIDEGGLRRTGRARPYEQRDESDDGS